MAWCLTRAIERHDAFRRLTSPDGQVIQQDAFDLGVAVALDGDRLATAVIHDARRWDWPGFCATYDQAIESVRAGRIEDVYASVNLTSLGRFGIAAAILIPYYLKNGVYTIPEFLELRYRKEARLFFSGMMLAICVVTAMMALSCRQIAPRCRSRFLQASPRACSGSGWRRTQNSSVNTRALSPKSWKNTCGAGSFWTSPWRSADSASSCATRRVSEP